MPFSDDDLAFIIDSHPNKATGTLAGGATVDGIYTAPGKNIGIFDGAINSLAPQFVTRAVDIAVNNIDIGTVITIKGIAFTITDTEERNDGMVGLPLTKG